MKKCGAGSEDDAVAKHVPLQCGAGSADEDGASCDDAVATEVMPWFDAEPCMPETTIEIFEEEGSINGNYFKRQFYGFTENVPRGMMQTGSYKKKGVLIRL